MAIADHHSRAAAVIHDGFLVGNTGLITIARHLRMLYRERDSLLVAALETIDAISAIAASGCESPGDMHEIDDIVVQFRRAYPDSHSDMAKESE